MPDQEDRKITLDIFDIANMLTDALQARGFLAPHEHISDIKDIKSDFTVFLVRHTLLTLGLCYLHHKNHSNKHGGARHHRAQEQGGDIGLPALQEKPYFIGAPVGKPLDKLML